MGNKYGILFWLFLYFILVNFAFADGWVIETVDTTDSVGRYTSIALDSNGYPHITYEDDTNDDLKYAYKSVSGWHIEIADGADVGLYSSIALDNDDYPHISYYADQILYFIEDLRYCFKDATGWHHHLVDFSGNTGLYTSIALDSNDRPYISYYAFTGYDLKFARYDGSTWHVSLVDTSGAVGACTSLALDTDDRANISYLGQGYLKNARWDGYNWQISPPIDPAYDTTSIALDSNDYAHISYAADTDFDLMYVYWDGYNWQFDTVDSTGEVGYQSSIDLDSSDNPHISYLDHTNGDLKYAAWNGSSWDITVVDSGGDVGRFTSITLDAYDNPHISYQDFFDNDLKYAYYETTGIIEDDTPTTPTGFYLSPAAPNPSTDGAIISFTIPHTCTVNLEVFDIKGRKIDTIAEGEYSAGEYETDMCGLSSGVYLYRMTADRFADTKLMIVK